MRGRSCTQPFLVEGGTCRPDALLLPPRWANRSPPHPTRLRRPTFPPRGRLWGWEGPFPSTKPTPPSPPSWGAGRYGRWFMGRRPGRKKERPPAGSPPTRKGGSREEEPLPPWCSFLRLSSKESRAPPPESAGPPGRCAPRWLRSHPPVGYAVPPSGEPQSKDKTPGGARGFIPLSRQCARQGARSGCCSNLGAQRQRVPNFKSSPSSHYTPPRPGHPGCSGPPRCCTPRAPRSARRR